MLHRICSLQDYLPSCWHVSTRPNSYMRFDWSVTDHVIWKYKKKNKDRKIAHAILQYFHISCKIRLLSDMTTRGLLFLIPCSHTVLFMHNYISVTSLFGGFLSRLGLRRGVVSSTLCFVEYVFKWSILIVHHHHVQKYSHQHLVLHEFIPFLWLLIVLCVVSIFVLCRLPLYT